ncbi:MAG: PAS domain S-box protein [Bacteroidota bacterium]|nr:PAS domain S-box protein [Bacteroidota bacterium]
MPAKNKKLSTTDLSTLNHLPVAVALFDNKKVYFLNTLAIKLFKVPKKYSSNFESLSIYRFLNKSFHKRIKENTKKILRGEDFPPVELEFKNFKNQTVHLEAKSNVVMFDNKYVIQTTFLEISERIKEKNQSLEIKNLLEETKQKFDLITQNGNDVISFYTYYPEEKYLYVSPNIKKILGYEPKELINDHEFFNKRTQDFSGEFKKIDDLLKSNQRKTIIQNHLYVYKTCKKNGEEVWIENNLAPILNKKGKIAFYINVYRDITLQKEKEIELELQKQNYQKLLDVTPTGYLIHKDGVCLYCNNALLKMLKLKSHSQILGKFATDFVTVQQRKRVLERMKEIMLGIKINEPRTYLLLDAKKNEVEVEITSTTINYNNQTCIVSLITNISIQKEQERQQLIIEITEKNNKRLQEEIKQRQEVQKSLLEKTAHLTSILDNSSHLIWTVNRNYQITSFNNNFNVLIYKRYNIKLDIGYVIAEKIKDEQVRTNYKNFWFAKYKKAFEGNKLEFEREDIDLANNKTIYRKVYINPIFDKNNNVIEISCIAHDITETKVYEQQLINQSAKLKAIFESGNHLIWTINRDYQITSYNHNYYTLIKNNIKNKKVFFLKDTIVDKNNLRLWEEKYEKVFNGEPQIFVHRTVIKNADVYREIFLHPIYSDNKIVEVSVIAQDITQRIINDNKIIDQAAKLNSIFDSSHHYIWTIDKGQRLTSFNKNYFDLISNIYNTQPYVGLSLNRGILNNDKEYNELLKNNYQKAFLGTATNFEIEVLDKHLNKVYLEVFLNPIYNNNNLITEVSGIAHDITDKKTSQQKIEQSLKEKEILLKEVHHRVKNNMQVISSILNLQSSYVNDEYALALLKESQNRIKTMAYIHESLYQNKSFTSVNFSEYIETLVKNIIQSYSLNEQKVKLILNLKKTTLNLDVSIPAGLIVNELVTNAIKHAFPANKIGTIIINLATENNIVFLEVKDNGKGFEDIVDFKNSPSLGLQLVNTLIDQIDGDLDFESDVESGTRILITFKM